MALKRGLTSLSTAAGGDDGSVANDGTAGEHRATKRPTHHADKSVDPVSLLLGNMPSTAVQRDLREQALRQLARSISQAAAPEDLSTFLRELQLGVLHRRDSAPNGLRTSTVGAKATVVTPEVSALLPRRRGTLLLAPSNVASGPALPKQQMPQKKKDHVGRRQAAALPPVPSFSDDKVIAGKRHSTPLPPVPSFTDDKARSAAASSTSAPTSGGSSSIAVSSTAASSGAVSSGAVSSKPVSAAAQSTSALSHEADAGDADSATDPAEVHQRTLDELSERPIVSDGTLDKARMEKITLRLLKCSLSDDTKASALTPGRWAQVWHAMQVPADDQVSAVITLLQVGLEAEAGRFAVAVSQLVTDLLKGHRIKLRNVEEALRGCVARCAKHREDGDGAWLAAIDACSRTGHDTALGVTSSWRRAQAFCASILVHLFPRPAQAGWGWSRIGWSWATWWACVGRVLEEAEPRASFCVIVMALSFMQERSGLPLFTQDGWEEESRVSKLRAKLVELIGTGDMELGLLLLRAGISLSPAEAEADVSEPFTPMEGATDVIVLEEEDSEDNMDQQAMEADVVEAPGMEDDEAEAAALHADIERLELQIAQYSTGTSEGAGEAALFGLGDEEEQEAAAIAEDVIEEATAADSDLGLAFP